MMLHANMSDRERVSVASDARLRVFLFGSMVVLDASGRSLLPRVRKTRAVLAMLALAAPQPLLRERITSLLWSRRDREQARASLRQCVHELQSILQPLGGEAFLQTGREHLALHTDGVWVDATALSRATRTRPESLTLLHSPLLEDLVGIDPAFDRWLDLERQRIVVEARSVAELVLTEQTEHDSVIAAAQQVLRIDRTHEGAWRALMMAHAGRGEAALAVEAYEHCSAALAEAARVSPSAETEKLLAGIQKGQFRATPMAAPLARTGSALAGERGVRLAVMPLRAPDAGSADFAEGLADEITTALSRFRGLSCVSPAGLANAPYDAGLWRVLDLDFVLEGSVQHSAGQLRVMVRLLDVGSAGEVIWGQRFQCEAVDLLTLQNDIASQTVAQLDSVLIVRQGRVMEQRPPAEVNAYHLLLRAIPAIYRLERENFLGAGDLLSEAVSLDRNYGAAHAWWAYWHLLLIGQGWAEDPTAATARTWDLTQRAITLDPGDARALTLAGHVRAFTHRRLPEAMALHERALIINPNLPLAWGFSGLAHIYAGQHEEALRRLRQAKLLSPLDPHGFFFDTGLNLAYLFIGKFEDAAEAGRRSVEMNPEFSAGFKAHLSALGYAGQEGERAKLLASLLRLEPHFTVSNALERSPLALPDDRFRFAEGLRLSGLPE